MLIDLMGNFITLQPGYDLVYYEREEPSSPGFILLDWVTVEIAKDCTSGPWYEVFKWGDLGEPDNEPIPMSGLLGVPPLNTGIGIDVDTLVPPDFYGCVRLSAPAGGDNDPAEVDALEVLP